MDFAKLSFIWVPRLHKSKRKTNTTQTTTTTPPRHQESCGQPKEGCTMPVSLRSGTCGSIGHPPDPPPGPCCAQIQAALAQPLNLGSAIGQEPAPIGYPNGPC
jgi:hypothetical protein